MKAQCGPEVTQHVCASVCLCERENIKTKNFFNTVVNVGLEMLNDLSQIEKSQTILCNVALLQPNTT